MTSGEISITAGLCVNALVVAYGAGRVVQLVRDIDARVKVLETILLRRRRTDFPDLKP